MKFRLGFVIALMMAGFLNFGFRGHATDTPDLSTPQKSFAAFVEVLKSGNVAALKNVATPTGRVSLVAICENSESKDGMAVLGKELEASTPQFEEITEDIYFASAKVGNDIHKMEFTKEEPGWMLYHWQIGGGSKGSENEPEPED